MLNQSTHVSVASSTASRCRLGPCRRITSVLNSPITDSARALSYASPRLPTDGAMARVSEAIGVSHREILRPLIAVMDEAVRPRAPARVNRLLERVQDEVRPERRRHAPADNPAREDVDDERDVDEAGPGRHVREVRPPGLIGPRGRKGALDQIARTIKSGLGLGGGGDPRPASDGAHQAHLPHQAAHTTARDGDAVAAQLPPDLPHPVHLEGLGPDATNLHAELVIPARPRRPARRIGMVGAVPKYVDGAIGNTAQIGSTP